MPEGTAISLKSFIAQEKLRPYKRSKVHRWFQKARGHHHSIRSLLSNALADAGAPQGLESCYKSTRTYQAAYFQEKAERIPRWGDLGNKHSIYFSQNG